VKPLPELSAPEQTRYSRHAILPEVGLEGQRRLKAASVLVVGAGGLGCPASMYLAAAGVGTIGLVDFDAVDLSNLQRQILYSVDDIGQQKLRSAAERLLRLNPEVTVNEHDARLCAENAGQIIERYDLVIDGTDNFATRYLVNDACVLLKKPNVYGSIYRFEGQVTVWSAGSGPCYRCLFPEPPPPETVPNCAEGGVLGVLAGAVGVLQATEAIKLILSLGDSLIGRLLLYDALSMRFDILRVGRDPGCPVCGDSPTIHELSDMAWQCSATGSGAGPEDALEISAVKLSESLREGRSICLLDVRNREEYDLCHLENSVLIPLNELPERCGELRPEAEIVAYCKSGARSRRAVDMLKSRGFENTKNLQGGILAWIREVDRSLPSY